MSRRRSFRSFAAAATAAAFAAGLSAAVIAAAASPAAAQDYPSRTIRIIVQTQPGGLIDQLARALAQKLEQGGATAIVENRTGGGGLIAAEHVANSPPDGYTIYVASHGTQAIHPHLTKNLPYDPQTSFAPVIFLATTPSLLVVNPTVPAKTLKELIAYAKANPGKLSYGSQGVGSSGHMIGELFKQVAGVEIVHVPYKGAAPAVRDLIAGHVQVVFDTVPHSGPHVKAGKLRGIAVVADKRTVELPDVPTFAEAGLPAMQGSPWFGLVVPGKTPRKIVDWINAAAKKAFTAPEVQKRFLDQGFILPLGTPEDFAAHIKEERERWGEVIRRAGLGKK
jgi:tripartite-type tricarboxylate transporter receptor subunit TctC